MNTKFEIFIPTSNVAVAKEYALLITQEFGGCTLRPGNTGYWIDPKRNLLVPDPIIILEVYGLAESQRKIEEIAQKIAKSLGQQCVSITVTKAEMLFIEP